MGKLMKQFKASKFSTKVKIAIGIGAVFIILVALIMVIFVRSYSSGNTQAEQNESSTISAKSTGEISLDQIVSFGVLEEDDSDYLVKLNSDLDYEEIIDLNENTSTNLEYMGYDYLDGKVYLVYGRNTTLKIYTVDVESYEKELVAELESDFDNSFTIYNDSIYYVTSGAIYKYSLEKSSIEIVASILENESITNMQFDKDNGIIYYMKNMPLDENYISCIYKLDLENGTEDIILDIDTEGIEILFKDNYLLCNILSSTETSENSKEYSLNYFYDMENDAIWELNGNDSVKNAIRKCSFYR